MRFYLGIFLFVGLILHTNALSDPDLKQLLLSALDKYVPQRPSAHINTVNISPVRKNLRNKRQLQSADPGAIMYLPIGGSGNIRYNSLCLG